METHPWRQPARLDAVNNQKAEAKADTGRAETEGALPEGAGEGGKQQGWPPKRSPCMDQAGSYAWGVRGMCTIGAGHAWAGMKPMHGDTVQNGRHSEATNASHLGHAPPSCRTPLAWGSGPACSIVSERLYAISVSCCTTCA